MKTKGFMQYLAGSLFLAFSLYQLYSEEPWEFALYSVAGAAFITMGLIKDNKFEKNRKLLNIISWLLILSAGMLFLFMVRTDAS